MHKETKGGKQRKPLGIKGFMEKKEKMQIFRGEKNGLTRRKGIAIMIDNICLTKERLNGNKKVYVRGCATVGIV